MKIDAIGVTSSNFAETVKFYSLIGFKFPQYSPEEDHIEANHKEGEIRLMIDSKKLITEILGYEPKPSNHSAFAIKFTKPEEINEVVNQLKENNYKVFKEPWDAFWGQRYAIVIDPDGYMIDLFCSL